MVKSLLVAAPLLLFCLTELIFGFLGDKSLCAETLNAMPSFCMFGISNALRRTPHNRQLPLFLVSSLKTVGGQGTYLSLEVASIFPSFSSNNTIMAAALQSTKRLSKNSSVRRRITGGCLGATLLVWGSFYYWISTQLQLVDLNSDNLLYSYCTREEIKQGRWTEITLPEAHYTPPEGYKKGKHSSSICQDFSRTQHNTYEWVPQNSTSTSLHFA